MVFCAWVPIAEPALTWLRFDAGLLAAAETSRSGVRSAATRPPVPWGDTSRLGRPFSKDPSVVRFGGRYLLYYSMPPFGDGRASDGWAIGIAESTVLGDWAKVGEVLVAEPYEGKGVAAPFAIVLEGRVHLFYQGYGSGPKDAICHAVSTDGVRFERDPTNPVFRPTGDWNVGRAIDAEVVRWGRGWLLYVATRDPQMKVQMLAGAVSDGGFDRASWRMLADRPILTPELPWEQDCIEAPTSSRRAARCSCSTVAPTTTRRSRSGWPAAPTASRGCGWVTARSCRTDGPGAWNSSESGHPAVFVDEDGSAYLFFQGNDDRGRTWKISFVRLGWRGGLPVVVPDEPPPGSRALSGRACPLSASAEEAPAESVHERLGFRRRTRLR